MFGLGFQELLIILAITLLLFGAKRVPELARSVGQAVRELRHGFREEAARPETVRTRKSKSIR
jgi:sec-independent protein translocase protein TatA